MYSEISSNKWKSVALMTGFLVLVIGLGWVFSVGFNEPIILPIAVTISIVQALISYFQGDKIALSLSGAKEAPRKDPYLTLHREVENIAIASGLPKPKLYIIEDDAPNAFATGRNPKNASVAVTTGLLNKLNKRELEGVLAHEMAHIGNYDIRVMTIVVVLVGVVSIMSDYLMRSMWFGGARRNSDNNNNQGAMLIVAIVAAIIAPLIATVIQLAVSRKREYLADSTAALITRFPEGLAGALEKISQDHHNLKHASSATNHLYISNPLKDKEKSSWLANLFSTHPPIKDRIKKLRGMIK